MNLLKQLWRVAQMTRRVGGLKAAQQLASDAPKQIALFRLLLTDPRVPVAAKAVLVGSDCVRGQPPEHSQLHSSPRRFG